MAASHSQSHLTIPSRCDVETVDTQKLWTT
jgi:hypothetical protein